MLLLFDLRLATNDRLHYILLAEQYVFAPAQAACEFCCGPSAGSIRGIEGLSANKYLHSKDMRLVSIGI